MNLLVEDKKHYFSVMLLEFTLLSCIYWYFFSFCFSSFLVYLLSLTFYITGYKFWLCIFREQKHLLFDNCEQFKVLSYIILAFILALNSLFSKDLFLMSFIYLLVLIIFIAYYIFRIKKQKKSVIPIQKFSSTTKVLTIMFAIFLLFDFVVWISGRMSIQLILYLPILFIILTFLFYIYKKNFSLNSLSSIILFANIYIISTILLVLNCIHNNFFTFMVLIHFVLFSSIVSLFTINSNENEEDNLLIAKEKFMSLIFSNIILIFISLNNILSFQIPQIFLSYLYFIAIIFITYIAYYHYKIFANNGY